jgi:hypothetical protein
VRRLDAILLATEPRAVKATRRPHACSPRASPNSDWAACRGARRKSSSATGLVSCVRPERANGRT